MLLKTFLLFRTSRKTEILVALFSLFFIYLSFYYCIAFFPYHYFANHPKKSCIWTESYEASFEEKKYFRRFVKTDGSGWRMLIFTLQFLIALLPNFHFLTNYKVKPGNKFAQSSWKIQMWDGLQFTIYKCSTTSSSPVFSNFWKVKRSFHIESCLCRTQIAINARFVHF